MLPEIHIIEETIDLTNEPSVVHASWIKTGKFVPAAWSWQQKEDIRPQEMFFRYYASYMKNQYANGIEIQPIHGGSLSKNNRWKYLYEVRQLPNRYVIELIFSDKPLITRPTNKPIISQQIKAMVSR